MGTTRDPAEAAASNRLDAAALPAPFAAFAAALVAGTRPVEEFLQLLETMAPKAGPAASIAYAEALRRAWPDHPLVRERTADIVRWTVPDYQLRMIADAARNRAYAEAIAGNVRPGMTVLEIGTGSGIMAMLAARAGAAHVYTVEINPGMAAIARRNIALNGLGGRITVIEGDALKLRAGGEVPVRCDALVHELFDTTLVGEGMFRLLAHAREELLTEAPLLLPDRVELWGQLDGGARKAPEFTDVCGFDLSALGLLDTGMDFIGRNPELAPLSGPLRLAEVDLNTARPAQAEPRVQPVEITASGTVRSLVQWIGFGFPGGTEFRNPPGVPSHWSLMRIGFPGPVPVSEGETRSLTIHLAARSLWYEFG